MAIGIPITCDNESSAVFVSSGSLDVRCRVSSAVLARPWAPRNSSLGPDDGFPALS
jgi:hypothetical protein